MEFVERNNFPIPKIIKTKSGKALFNYKNKKMLIQKFIEGRQPKKFNNALIKDIAKKQSSLNKKLLKLKLQGRYTWDKNHQFKPMTFEIRKIGTFNLKKMQICL